MTQSIQESIRLSILRLMIATGVLYLVVFAAVVVVYWDSAHKRAELQEVAVGANKALCALRQNLKNQVQSSQQYLLDVDAGRRIPVIGISRADVLAGIRRQQQTIHTLSGLECPPSL